MSESNLTPNAIKSTEQGERLLTPELIIRPQTSNEEFDYLKFVLNGVPFYKQYGYTFEIPDDPEFQKLLQVSPNFDEVDWDRVKNHFVNHLYEEGFYRAGLQALEAKRGRLERAFPYFEEFHNNWGFKLFPRYDVALTRYGPGGMYDENTGKITMLTRRDGTFKRKHPSHTPVHEMVHIGVEDNIVKRFALTHPEKERVVDRICSLKFGEFLPRYEMQELGNKRIDPFVTDDSLADLPKAIEAYCEKYPRET